MRNPAPYPCQRERPAERGRVGSTWRLVTFDRKGHPHLTRGDCALSVDGFNPASADPYQGLFVCRKSGLFAVEQRHRSANPPATNT
jgi:hypothetical protein